MKFLRDRKVERERSMFSSGRPCWHSKKLHNVTEMLDGDARPVHDHTEWASMVQTYFGHLWRCGDPHLRPLVDDWLLRHRGHGITIEGEEAVSAIKLLRHRNIIDCLGCCPSSALLLSQASPEYLAKVLTSLAKSQEQWQSLTIIGRVKAKTKGPVRPSKLRTILPLPALVAASDVIVAKRLNEMAETITAE